MIDSLTDVTRGERQRLPPTCPWWNDGLSSSVPRTGGQTFWRSTNWYAINWGYFTVTRHNLDWTRNMIAGGYFTRIHSNLH